MIAYQLSVHAENKPGQLAGVTALLARLHLQQQNPVL